MLLGARELQQSESESDLGIIICKNLSWTEHICPRCNKVPNLTYSSVPNLLIVPNITYSSVAWHASKTDARVLEGDQRLCSKWILGVYDLPYKDRLQQLSIVPLSLNMNICPLLMLSNILSSKYDYDCSNHFRVASRSSESQLFRLPLISKERCRDSFWYRMPRLADFLPTWVKFMQPMGLKCILIKFFIRYFHMPCVLKKKLGSNKCPFLEVLHVFLELCSSKTNLCWV